MIRTANIIAAVLATNTLLWAIELLAGSPKQIVGATEVIHIEEVGMDFLARVDTGAESTSIHAGNIRTGNKSAVSGAAISFDLTNKSGQSARLEGRISEVVLIRTAEGSERRYKVPLTLRWRDTRKTVLVSLNNRESMRYGLLLGRNWLRGDFIVDVDLNNTD